MKNRKREICTSGYSEGSPQSIALPIYSAADNFCIWPRALPRCRLVAHRKGASLSDAAGAHHRRLCRRRLDRYYRASDGPMAVGALRSTIYCRESAGCRQQYRHGGGGKCGRRRLHAAYGRANNAINTTLYDKLNFDFIRDIAPIASIARSLMSWR